VSGYVPLLMSMNNDFHMPLMTDLVAEICFSPDDVEKLKNALDAEGRYNF